MWIVIVIICLMALFPVKGSENSGRARGFVYSETISIKHGEAMHTFKAGVVLETLIAQMIPVIAIGAGLIVKYKDNKET